MPFHEISLSEVQAVLGDHLNLNITTLGSNELISFTASVIKIFSPITKSLVAHIQISHSSTPLPDSAILKIYDPRFIDDRLPLGRSSQEEADEDEIAHPWSLDLEVASVRRREAIGRGELEDDFPEHVWCDAEPIIWEENLYRWSKARFEDELEAYSRCEALQGGEMARCFGSGVLNLDSARPIKPPFILLEYILGTPMPLMDPTAITKPIIYKLLNTIITYTSLGVVHNDPRPDNIIFSPPTPSAPKRVVLLDFGEAIIRTALNSDNEDWEDTVRSIGDWMNVTRWLIEAGVQGVPRPYDNSIPDNFSIVEATLSLKEAAGQEECPG